MNIWGVWTLFADLVGVPKIGETWEIFPTSSGVIRDWTLFQFRKKVNPDKIVRVADKNVCYWKGASIQGDLMNRIGVSASAENKSYVPKAGMQICSKLSRFQEDVSKTGQTYPRPSKLLPRPKSVTASSNQRTFPRIK